MEDEARHLGAANEAEIWAALTPDGRTYRFVMSDEMSVPPPDWPVLIGEILHNLRSALDHAAYELSERSLQRALSPKEEGASQFPVVREPATFAAEAKRRLPGVDDVNAIDVIERVQPYPDRPYGYAPSLLEMGAHHIGLLHDWNRFEKHRQAPVVIASQTGAISHGDWPFPVTRNDVAIGPGDLVAEMGFHPDYLPNFSRLPVFGLSPVIHYDGHNRAVPGSFFFMAQAVQRVLDALDGSPARHQMREYLLKPFRRP